MPWQWKGARTNILYVAGATLDAEWESRLGELDFGLVRWMFTLPRTAAPPRRP